MNPIFLIPYSVSTLQEEMFKREVDRLVQLGVLEIDNDSLWGFPSFAQPKPKLNQVRFLSYIRNINKQ